MSRDRNDPEAAETVISEGRAAPAQHSGARDAPDVGDPTPALAPDLARVVEAWADLPPALRAGIVAMVKAAASGESHPAS